MTDPSTIDREIVDEVRVEICSGIESFLENRGQREAVYCALDEIEPLLTGEARRWDNRLNRKEQRLVALGVFEWFVTTLADEDAAQQVLDYLEETSAPTTKNDLDLVDQAGARLALWEHYNDVARPLNGIRNLIDDLPARARLVRESLPQDKTLDVEASQTAKVGLDSYLKGLADIEQRLVIARDALGRLRPAARENVLQLVLLGYGEQIHEKVSQWHG